VRVAHGGYDDVGEDIDCRKAFLGLAVLGCRRHHHEVEIGRDDDALAAPAERGALPPFGRYAGGGAEIFTDGRSSIFW
jgi:hypothetical protein